MTYVEPCSKCFRQDYDGLRDEWGRCLDCELTDREVDPDEWRER